MRFMGFVKMAEGIGAPPQGLMDAMDEFIGESVANGQFLDGGGLYGTEDAVENTRRMAELHAEHWPEIEVVIELRQISGGPELPQT